MKIEIKMIDYSDISNAMNLIEECFDKFVAPDYSEKGIKTFKDSFIHYPKFINKFSDGDERMYGAYSDNILVGCQRIIKLNASPYAVPFYHAIGFEEIGQENEFEGIRYTPMSIEIK